MTGIRDLNDPRYLDEIGWLRCHEKYGRDSANLRSSSVA